MDTFLTDDEFKRLQKLQTEMVVELDRVCRKHNIKYSLFAGTLLGAVRHKAHIPWDDDIDIAMLREDYNKLRDLADELDSDICFFQDHKTDPEYLWGYGKLRKTDTVFIRQGQEHIKCKTGIYIDIFPLDDVPISLLGQMLLDFKCYCLRKILWAKVGCVTEKGILKAWYKLLAKIPTDFVYKRTEKYRKRSNNNTPNKVRTLLFPSFGKFCGKRNPLREKYGVPKKWFLELDEYEFEGYKFLGTKDYDGLLKYEYNDYMKLPPESQRQPKVEFLSIKF